MENFCPSAICQPDEFVNPSPGGLTDWRPSKSKGDDCANCMFAVGRYRIEVGGKMAGLPFQAGMIVLLENVMSLGLINAEYAVPVTPVGFAWREHPGPDHDAQCRIEFSAHSGNRGTVSVYYARAQ